MVTHLAAVTSVTAFSYVNSLAWICFHLPMFIHISLPTQFFLSLESQTILSTFKRHIIWPHLLWLFPMFSPKPSAVVRSDSSVFKASYLVIFPIQYSSQYKIHYFSPYLLLKHSESLSQHFTFKDIYIPCNIF